MPESKRCGMCGEVKPLEEFHRDRRRKDGRQNRCKPCNIAINRRWYAEHPEARDVRMDAYAKERRRQHQALILE